MSETTQTGLRVKLDMAAIVLVIFQALAGIWWASSMTAAVASLDKRMSAVEISSPVANAQLSIMNANVAALTQQVKDMSDFVMKKP
jgi:hypothetical protein